MATIKLLVVKKANKKAVKKYNPNNNINSLYPKIAKIIDAINNKQNKVGNQNTSLLVLGCQWFKIGLTNPNLCTCV